MLGSFGTVICNVPDVCYQEVGALGWQHSEAHVLQLLLEVLSLALQ